VCPGVLEEAVLYKQVPPDGRFPVTVLREFIPPVYILNELSAHPIHLRTDDLTPESIACVNTVLTHRPRRVIPDAIVEPKTTVVGTNGSSTDNPRIPNEIAGEE
jgi:hypothetical protein